MCFKYRTDNQDIQAPSRCLSGWLSLRSISYESYVRDPSHMDIHMKSTCSVSLAEMRSTQVSLNRDSLVLGTLIRNWTPFTSIEASNISVSSYFLSRHGICSCGNHPLWAFLGVFLLSGGGEEIKLFFIHKDDVFAV